MKKFISSLLVLTFIIAAISPAVNAQSGLDTQQNVVRGMGNEYTEAQSLQIIEATEVMNEYIELKNNGHLKLHPKARKEVEPFVYEHYKRGVESLNESVDKGVITLNGETHLPELNVDSTKINPNGDPYESQLLSSGEFSTLSSTGGEFTTQSWTDFEWWGVKWYLSYSESKYWQNRFSDYAFGWSVIAAIAGVIGAPFASIAAIIMAAGNYYFYRELRDNRSWRGSVLVFRWAPPWAWAYAR